MMRDSKVRDYVIYCGEEGYLERPFLHVESLIFHIRNRLTSLIAQNIVTSRRKLHIGIGGLATRLTGKIVSSHQEMYA